MISSLEDLIQGGGGDLAVSAAEGGGLFSSTYALHFCFVLNSTDRAHASVSHSGGWTEAWARRRGAL